MKALPLNLLLATSCLSFQAMAYDYENKTLEDIRKDAAFNELQAMLYAKKGKEEAASTYRKMSIINKQVYDKGDEAFIKAFDWSEYETLEESLEPLKMPGNDTPE